MARVDDIPDQFLRSSNLKCSHIQEFTNLFGVPAVKEPTPSSDGIKEQPGKINHLRPNKPLPFPSKFGTFLEPVSEEVELSSQGSVNLSPVAMKTLSFESNRSSTLKGDSYEESPENIMKIPSLKDLWKSQPDEAETECSSRKYSGNFETVTEDVEEYSIEQTDHAQNQDEDSEVSKKQWGIPGISESIPTVADYLAGEEILVSDESLVSLDVEDVKTGQHLFEEDGSDSLTSGLETLDKEVVSISTSESSDSIQKSPSGRTRSSKNIAPVKISKTAERTRKISTVTLPDRKNFSLDVVQSNGGNSSHTVRNSHGKLGKQVLGRKEITKNTLHLNLYKNWVDIEETGQRQIHMSNKEHLKDSDSAFSQSHKSADAKVIVKHFHFPSQIVLPEVNSQDVKCFSNFKTGCVRTSEVLRIRSAATSRSCSGDSSGFLSLTTPSEQSTPEQVGHKTNVFVSHHNPRQPDRVEKCKELVNDEHKYRENELLFDCYCENDVKADSAHSFVNDWRNNQQLLKNGKSIEVCKSED